MSVNVYTPDSTKIIHNTSVDFVTRYINNPVHLVQFDNSTPIIAIKLYSNGTPYVIPEGMNVNIKIRKPDKTVIYNPVLGCDASRTIVYVEATTQMCAVNGELYPVVEIADLTTVAASGYFYVEVDRNPVNADDVQSTSEARAIQEFVDLSKSWAIGETGVREDEDTNNSKYWAGVSANYEAEAAVYANDAIRSAAEAKVSEDNAAASANSAEGFATDAETAEQNSEANATLAKSWAVGGTGTRVDEDTYNAFYYASEAAKSETNADASASDAKTSEDNAAGSATLAESWAIGGTGTRAGEDSDNAKFWANKAEAVSGLHIATTTVAGIVKPDGDSTWVDPDGTIHSKAGMADGNMRWEDYDTNHDKKVNAADVADAVGNADTSVLEGLSDDGSGNLLYNEKPISSDSDDVWAGTKEEYAIDDQAGKVKDGTVVVIDNDEEELPSYVNPRDFDLTNGVLSLNDSIHEKFAAQILGVIDGDTVTFTDSKYIGGTDSYLLDPYVSDTDRFLVSQSISGDTFTIVCDDAIKSDSIAICLVHKKEV